MNSSSISLAAVTRRGWRYLVDRPWLLALVVVLVSAVGVALLVQVKAPFFSAGSGRSPTATTSWRDGQVIELRHRDHRYPVEVVVSRAAITQGLSGRSAIGDARQGMLFVLPERTQPYFWMKDMQFDLDLIWIDGRTIVGITPQVPKPLSAQTPDAELPTYPAPAPVTHVLEVPAGQAAAWGWAVGDTVAF